MLKGWLGGVVKEVLRRMFGDRYKATFRGTIYKSMVFNAKFIRRRLIWWFAVVENPGNLPIHFDASSRDAH